MRIRDEESSDQEAVYAVNSAAFPTPAEADLVVALHGRNVPLISLVADIGNQVVGHILFSPVSLAGHPEVKIMGLGPMAVLPAYQRSGVGSALVRAGLERCRDRGFAAVVVLGHREYYPRFGFSPATDFNVQSDYDVPTDVFMLLELLPGALRGSGGIARYHSLFADV